MNKINIDHKISEIEGRKTYYTKEYSIFNKREGNRTVDPNHVSALADIMKEHGWMGAPIIINEKREVIDGQNRVQAAEMAGVGVEFQVFEGYSDDEMILLNINSKTWSQKDYMEYYASKGYEHYQTLKEFYNEYPFSLSNCVKLLQNNNSNSKTAAHKRHGPRNEVFEEGTWTVTDLDTALVWAENILKIKKYYDGYNRTTFISAMINLFRIDIFSFDEFIRKLKFNPRMLVNCTSVDQYTEIIEDIYNYRNQHKISLKYAVINNRGKH